jgi:hypothetical protein
MFNLLPTNLAVRNSAEQVCVAKEEEIGGEVRAVNQPDVTYVYAVTWISKEFTVYSVSANLGCTHSAPERKLAPVNGSRVYALWDSVESKREREREREKNNGRTKDRQKEK